ncbi:hypothetical protein A9D60_23140 [Leisingera sp. JC1]|nr:hypothetical protein A9D60_23140 [Leisingera sp. JC1]
MQKFGPEVRKRAQARHRSCRGLQGHFCATPPTRDLCGLLLPDSGRLQEEEAQHARRNGYSKHKRPAPLYTEAVNRRAKLDLKQIWCSPTS